MSEADKTEARCTCPSGDGSLRWPCPAHPSAPQGGGEEVWMFKGTDGAWHTFHNDQHRLDTIADGRWDVRKFAAQPRADASEPEVHGYDPTDRRESVTIRWPDGKCLGYVLDRTRYTDNLPRTDAAQQGEVCIRVPGVGEGGPYPVVDGVCVLPPAVAERLVASAVGREMKREAMNRWGGTAPPSAPVGVDKKAERRLIDVAASMLNDNNGKIGKRHFRADATAVVRRVLKALAQQPAAVDEAVLQDIADATAALDKRGDRQMASRLMRLHARLLAGQQQGGAA